MSRHRRPNRLERVFGKHDRYEADLRDDKLQRGRVWCDSCGNRTGSAACKKACGGGR